MKNNENEFDEKIIEDPVVKDIVNNFESYKDYSRSLRLENDGLNFGDW